MNKLRPTERREAIYTELRAKRHLTIGYLAEKYGVNERTIRRDIEELTLVYPMWHLRLFRNMNVCRQLITKLQDSISVRFLSCQQAAPLTTLQTFLKTRATLSAQFRLTSVISLEIAAQ